MQLLEAALGASTLPAAVRSVARLPWYRTDAGRRYYANRRARCRQRWTAAGLCVECGRERKAPTLRCGLCLVGNVIRVDRCVYRKRMAKATLEARA